MRLDSGVTKQSGFTIVAPVEADKIAAVTSLLDEIGSDIKGNRHLRLAELENLHYASFVVFEPEGSDPFLLFEGNIDGPPRKFLEQLVAAAPAAVDFIYGHCVGYATNAASDPGAAVGYLTSRDLGVGTLYIAWRGRDVTDIHREHELRNRLGEVLDQEAATLAGQTPEAIRSRLRQVVEQAALRAEPGQDAAVPVTQLNRETKAALGIALAAEFLRTVNQRFKEPPEFITQFKQAYLTGGPYLDREGKQKVSLGLGTFDASANKVRLSGSIFDIDYPSQ